jgi:hypothetical protein
MNVTKEKQIQLIGNKKEMCLTYKMEVLRDISYDHNSTKTLLLSQMYL